MLFYRAAVDVSRSTLNYVAGLTRRRRKAIGSIWRRLNPGQQALLVLVYLRKGETFSELAAGFGVSTATTWRYVVKRWALLRGEIPVRRNFGDVSASNKPGDSTSATNRIRTPTRRMTFLIMPGACPARHRRPGRHRPV